MHDPRPVEKVLFERALLENRRQFFGRAARSLMSGLGLASLASLLDGDRALATLGGGTSRAGGLAGIPHFAPKAKRVIYLFMSGAPSQIDLWDHKPKLHDLFDTDLPESIRMGQRLTTMTSGQARFPIAPSKFAFSPAGSNGLMVSELLPMTSRIVDELCVIRSMHTEAINHDPAITFMHTGTQQPGRPSFGSWLSYGLGSETAELPAFVVLHSSWTGRQEDQALFNRLWGSGFLPASHQGVALRSSGDPVLYLNDPPGIDRDLRRAMLDGVAELNRRTAERIGDPETLARIEQYEMAFRMQSSVPELTDLSGEDEATFELYGPEARKPGTFSANCLLARRLVERGVRVVQLYIRGWDNHSDLPRDLANSARDIDHGCHGLVLDLKRRGMLDDTLVVWGGEFGRTAYCQGTLTKENYGRDHHPRAWTMWMAGGGVKAGHVHGETDDFSYNVVRDPVHVHDLNATILHQLGIDHERLTYRFQGRDFRLTDVHGRVVPELLA